MWDTGDYRAIFDGDSFIDGIRYETFEAAKNSALDCLIEWASQELDEAFRKLPENHKFRDSYDIQDMRDIEDIRDSWNSMVCNCMTWVEHYEPDSEYASEDGWIGVWSPSDEDLERIGWVEIEEE